MGDAYLGFILDFIDKMIANAEEMGSFQDITNAGMERVPPDILLSKPFPMHFVES